MIFASRREPPHEICRSMRVLAVLLLAACADRQPTHIVPLSELRAEMQLGGDDRIFSRETTLRLHPEYNASYCPILSPRNSRAVMDGAGGKLDAGGGSNQTLNDELDCLDPAFVWENPPRIDGPSTFDITDGSTTWTFVVWQPFVDASAEVVSHPAEQPVLAGETVVIEATGPLFDATLVARDDGGTMLFELDATTGLTVAGAEASFVMPAVTATVVRLEVRGEIEKRIDRCDASLGCQTRYALAAFMQITFASLR
jgi:hypothetical protein